MAAEMTDEFDPDAIGREYGEEPPATSSAYAVPPLRFQRVDAFLAERIAPPRWLCMDTVPEGSIGFIGGAPKAFKSWLAIDLAVALASGGAFCGRFLCPEPRRVLLVQFESSRAAYQKRVRAVVERCEEPPDGLFVISNAAVLFEDDASLGRLTSAIEEVRPDLLILDPFAAMTTGNENSAQEMGLIVRQLRAWRDRYGCAITVVHHTNKAAGSSGAGVRSGLKLRGSSAFYAAAEWALWIERPNEAAPRIEVRVEQKESEPRRPFVVEFNGERADLRVVADEISAFVKDDDLIEAVIARHGRATAKDLASDFPMNERTIRDRMSALVEKRRVDIDPGTGRGRKPVVWLVRRGSQTRPRPTAEPHP